MRSAAILPQSSIGKTSQFSLITQQYGLMLSPPLRDNLSCTRKKAYRQSYRQHRPSSCVCFATLFPTVQTVSSSYCPRVLSQGRRPHHPNAGPPCLTIASTRRLQQGSIPSMTSRTSFTQIGMPMFLPPYAAVLATGIERLGLCLTRIPRFNKIGSVKSRVVRRRPRRALLPPPMIFCRGSVPTSNDEKLRLRALALFRDGDLDKASELLKQSIRVRPENGRAWQDFAKVEGKRRKSTDASVSILKKAVECNSQNPYLWQSLGFYLWRLREHDAARDCFEKGILADPSHSSLYTTYGRLEFEQGNSVKARELFEKGVTAGATDARLFHCWGLMEMKLGNTGRARSLFQKGLTIDKKNPFLWHSLAGMARKEGDIDGARICNENALNTGRSGVAVLDALAKLEAHEGNNDLARDLFSKGVAAFPDDVRILHSWSLFEYQRGKLNVAKSLIQKGLRKNPRDSFLWTHYAKIEEARENYPLARSLFRRACTLCARDWRAWDQWSAMEHKLGNFQESEVLLNESFRIRFNAKGAFAILANSIRDKY